MDNTILIIAVIVAQLVACFGLIRLSRSKREAELKHGRVLRERDALATRVRCQRERLRGLEKADARRAKALEKLVDVAWDVFEFQTDDKGLKRDFAEAFEDYTGKPLGSLGPSAVVESSEESAEQEAAFGERELLESFAANLRNALRVTAPEVWLTHIEQAIADAFKVGRGGVTKADVVGAPAAEEGGGK